MKKILVVSIACGIFAASAAQAAPALIAIGSLNGTTDFSGLTGTLENGVDSANILGGIGSGLAWASLWSSSWD